MAIDVRPISREKVALILERHLNEKKTNKEWLYSCLNGHAAAFPYTAKGKEGTVTKEIFEPLNQPSRMPTARESELPCYLVNVPFAHRPEQKGYETVLKLLNLYRNEAFGENALESNREVPKRFSLVIGVNQIVSLDTNVNREFAEWVYALPKIKGVAYRVIGFFWEPVWKKHQDASILTYTPGKAFTLLKHLSSQAALGVRTMFEGTADKLNEGIIDQIPFQRIREKIKNSPQTTGFTAHISAGNPLSLLYYGVMDSDALKLNKGQGLFTRYDRFIQANLIPSAITLGYSVDEPLRPLIEFGVELDMACRAATNRVISYGAYFPEPTSLFRFRNPKDLSFLGEGRGLENRRLIQNGLKTGVLHRRAVFVADGGVSTTTPARMKTNKNGKVQTLTAKALKTKSNLQALRGISQSHIFQKNWADNLYLALDFKAPRVTDATGPMMQLFSIYDPLSRMLDTPGRFSPTVVDTVIRNYGQPLSLEQTNNQITARNNLLALGMNEELVNKIEEAAFAAGLAILNTFQVKLDELAK